MCFLGFTPLLREATEAWQNQSNKKPSFIQQYLLYKHKLKYVICIDMYCHMHLDLSKLNTTELAWRKHFIASNHFKAWRATPWRTKRPSLTFAESTAVRYHKLRTIEVLLLSFRQHGLTKVVVLSHSKFSRKLRKLRTIVLWSALNLKSQGTVPKQKKRLQSISATIGFGGTVFGIFVRASAGSFKFIIMHRYCWWFRNPKQPPGMYKTLVNNGKKLPTSTGDRRILFHQQYWCKYHQSQSGLP